MNVKKDRKVRVTINVQVKQEIIEEHERFVKAGALDSEHGLHQSTILRVMNLFMLICLLFSHVLININVLVCSYNIYLLKLYV